MTHSSRMAVGGQGLQIGAAIKALEDAAFQPDGFAESFVRVAHCLDARTFHMAHDPGVGLLDFVIANENRSFLNDYIKGNWNDLDIWTERMRNVCHRGRTRVTTDTQIIPGEERIRSAFFQEFYHKWGIGHVACWGFKAEGRDLGFTLKREAGRAFSDVDIAELEIFKRAANRVGLFVTAFHKQHVLGFLEGLEASGRPSMALNHAGEVAYLTRSAEDLVGNGFSIRRGVPYGTTPRAEAGFARLRQWILTRGAELPLPFSIDRLASRHPIAAIPVRIPDNGLLALPFAKVVVMLLDLSERPVMPGGLLRSMFGLTQREADIASLLASGHDITEIAERSNLKPASARQVIKSIMAKAGVNRQSELVAILSRLS